jgi:hypothetical protein
MIVLLTTNTQTDMAVKIRVTFSECEHDGDMDNYTDDIVKCGGRIISTSVDPDAEEGVAIFEVDDKPAFVEKFKQTDAWQFI